MCIIAFPRETPKSMLDISDETLREDLLNRLIDSKLMGPALQIGFHHSPEGLPERKLPHGNWATLFLLYVAYCQSAGEDPACKSVFYDVAKRWKVCLRFHKPSVHSTCLLCSTLKAQIANASDPLKQSVNIMLSHAVSFFLD